MDNTDRSADYAALGEMVALVRSLEFVVYRVAECLGVRDPARGSAAQAIDEAEKQVRLGLPPWAPNLPPANVKAWLAQAKGVLTNRHRHIHWFHGTQLHDGMDIRLNPRAEVSQRWNDAEMPRLIERARAAAHVGHGLLRDHLHVTLPDGQQVPPDEHQGMERSWLSWWRKRIASEGGLGDAPCAWLTTLRRDGSPHTTPVWFLLIDDTFWIASSTANVKVKNAVRDARVSLAIDGTGSQPHVAQGRAIVHRRIGDFPQLVSLLAEKYDGWDAADESQDGPRVLLEVPVDRWLLARA